MAVRGAHPLDWRRELMQPCDCCESGEKCSECGWHEDQPNPARVHARHIKHAVAKRRELETAAATDERNRYQ